MMEPLGLKKTSSTLSFRSVGSGKIENVGDIRVINGYIGGKMKRLSLLIIMMATWMVAGCGTTDGTKKVGPELGYYENKKDIKGDSLIFSATSVWHCIMADKPWLDKTCD